MPTLRSCVYSRPMSIPGDPVTTNERGVALAGIFRIAAIASQPVVMIALLVLWKHFHVSFWTAVEWCLVAGIGASTALAACASILLTLARIQPVALLLSHVTRFVSVVVFAFLRYVH